MSSSHPRHSDEEQQARRLRLETRCLKFWKRKVRAAGLVLGFVLAAHSAHADESTGLPDDPKAMTPPRTFAEETGGFLPLPAWSRFVTMPPLPDALKPLGKKVTVAPPAPDPAKATPAAPAAPSTMAVIKPPPPKEEPALVAVSPFLQWVHDNKDAAAEARRQADAYRPTPPPAAPGQATPTVDPYWLPPLIDGPSGGDATSSTVGGSAAIYSKPVRD